jgi:hypothetical protein
MMTRLTTKCMIAVATFVAAAGSASAQNLLKADIPFTFRAGNALMQPGTYQVSPPSGNSHYIVLRNEDTHASIILAGYTAGDPEKGWKDSGVSRLRFECLGHQCVLRELWSASSAYAQVFPGPKLGRDDAPQITEIRMTRSKAD